MEQLSRSFSVVPLNEGLESAPLRSSRPRVAITFDDGYANNLHLALPILRHLGLPATVFVVADFATNPQVPWWDELDLLLTQPPVAEFPSEIGVLDLRQGSLGTSYQLVRDYCMRSLPDGRARVLEAIRARCGAPDPGLCAALTTASWTELRATPDLIRFGNHTATHRVLDLCDPAAVAWETTEGEAALQRHLDPSRFDKEVLCYPRGAISGEGVRVVHELGIRWALGLGAGPTGIATAGPGSDKYYLPRLVVGPHFSDARFRLAASGLFGSSGSPGAPSSGIVL